MTVFRAQYQFQKPFYVGAETLLDAAKMIQNDELIELVALGTLWLEEKK